jgi:hypothetical protein
MSLLTEFTASLLPDERERLRTIPVRGKQASILTAVLKDPTDESGVRKAASDFGMSPSHLHATQSMLLSRAYETIVPAGGIDLLQFLRVRGLEAHFKRELNEQERLMSGEEVSAEARHEFYLRVLNILFAFTSAGHDQKLQSGILLLFKKTIVRPHPDDELHIRICDALGETMHLLGNPRRSDPGERTAALLRRLTALREELGESDHHLARYHLAYAFAVYYAILDTNPLHSETYVQTLSDELAHLPEVIRRDELPKAMLRKASLHFMNGQYANALEIYQSQYGEHGIGLYRMYGFHRDWFVRCALVEREFTIAREIIDTSYSPFFHLGNSPVATAGRMHETTMHVLTRNLTDARRSLKKAFSINTGDLFVFSLEMNLRFLEIVLEILSGSEPEYVSQLISRSIKYLSRKGVTLKSGNEAILFYALRDINDGNTESEFARIIERDGFSPNPPFVHFFEMVKKEKARRTRRASK